MNFGYGLATLVLIAASAAHGEHVPFVGCATDGQQGPAAAPQSGQAPEVARPAAARLAYYATADVGVLAPRGWHCFGWEGSNGSGIVVAPRTLDWRAIVPRSNFRGHGVILSQISGSTSGRLEVAEIAARAFPSVGKFVASVEAEGLNDKPFARGPYRSDRRTFRGPNQLLFTTPAGKTGMGTYRGFAPGNLPIDGVLELHPDDEMDLTSLAVRLPAAMRPLVADIIKQIAPAPKR